MGAPAFYQHIEQAKAAQRVPSLKESQAAIDRQAKAIADEIDRLSRGA